MAKYPQVGDAVVYHDEVAQPHNALVTAYHGQVDEAGQPVGNVGCINLVFVSGDPARKDPYGRQIERLSSIAAREGWYAHGHYWRWPEEEPIPVKAPSRT